MQKGPQATHWRTGHSGGARSCSKPAFWRHQRVGTRNGLSPRGHLGGLSILKSGRVRAVPGRPNGFTGVLQRYSSHGGSCKRLPSLYLWCRVHLARAAGCCWGDSFVAAANPRGFDLTAETRRAQRLWLPPSLRSSRLGGFIGGWGQRLRFCQALFWRPSASGEMRSSRLPSPQIPSPAGHYAS